MSDTSSFGYGQQDPNDSAAEFNAISFLVRQMIARIETMKLVKVAAVKSNGEVAAAGTVDVIPLVSQLDGAGNAVPHGTVYGLPWSRVQGGLNAVICDPAVGDIGYVVVADRDISSVKATQKASTPGSRRQFNLADGVYAGGALNVTPTQYIVFTATGIRIVDKNGNSVAFSDTGLTLTDLSGNVVSTTSSGIALTPKGGQPVTVNGSLIVTGNLQLEGNIESQTGGIYAGDLKTSGNIIARVGASQVGLATHTHTQGNDSHGDTEVPTNAPTAGS